MSHARNLARIARTGIHTVPTAQALRELVIYGGAYPEVVLTKSAMSAGDGGGGLWALHKSGTPGTYISDDTHPDNVQKARCPGTVIVPNGGDGSVAYIREIENSTYNVRWWGPVLDTVTDSTAAGQLAVDAAWKAGGGTVIFPHNIYFGVRGVWARSKITYRGEHAKARVYGEAHVFHNFNGIIIVGSANDKVPGAYWPSVGIPSLGWESLGGIPANDVIETSKSITLTAGHSYIVDDIVIIRSSATVSFVESAHNVTMTIPLQVHVSRVVAVNGATLELEKRFPLSITSPLVLSGNLYAGDRSILHDVVFEDMVLLPKRIAISGDGLYNARFSNLTVIGRGMPSAPGSSALSFNLAHFVVAENIEIHTAPNQPANSSQILDIKGSSASCSFNNFTVFCDPAFDSGFLGGYEGDRDFSYDNWVVYAQKSTVQEIANYNKFMFGYVRYTNIKIYANIVNYAFIIERSPVEKSGLLIDNFYVEASRVNYAFEGSADSSMFTPRPVGGGVINNVFFSVPTLTNGYRFQAPLPWLNFSNCRINGVISVGGSMVTSDIPVINNCEHLGFAYLNEAKKVAPRMTGCRTVNKLPSRNVFSTAYKPLVPGTELLLMEYALSADARVLNGDMIEMAANLLYYGAGATLSARINWQSDNPQAVEATPDSGQIGSIAGINGNQVIEVRATISVLNSTRFRILMELNGPTRNVYTVDFTGSPVYRTFRLYSFQPHGSQGQMFNSQCRGNFINNGDFLHFT